MADPHLGGAAQRRFVWLEPYPTVCAMRKEFIGAELVVDRHEGAPTSMLGDTFAPDQGIQGLPSTTSKEGSGATGSLVREVD